MNTEYINTLHREYIEKHIKLQIREELISENNIERRDIKGYHGREILELLQNADDAYQKSIDLGCQSESELNVNISYSQGRLIVANTGTFFDDEGIKAIVQGNNSPKKGKYIGNKGTGFRSILNWADEVRIYSGEYAIKFSKEIASKILDSLKNEEQIAKQLAKEPNLYIPMLAVPENIEHNRPKNQTTIEVYIKAEETTDDFSVESQLDNIDLRILLFLPNISRINIRTDQNNICYERKISDEKVSGEIRSVNIELCKIDNDIIICKEKFHLYRKSIPNVIDDDGITKDIQLAIAVPYDNNNIKHLYSYFPLLDTDSPFNCILHATYSLGDHRNTIHFSEINKRIVETQLDFLVEVAKIFISNKELNKAYEILLPANYRDGYIWSFSTSFSKFNLEDYYIKSLSKLLMFRTVNDQLISIEDRPNIIQHKFPQILIGETFNKLLKYTDDPNQNSLIKLISTRLGLDLSLSHHELCRAINIHSDKWNITQQIEVFIWWNEYYRNSKLLPKLIKNQLGDWLEFNEECYFLEGDFDSIELPNWVEVPAIYERYQKKLIDEVLNMPIYTDKEDDNRKKNVIRFICQHKIFPIVNFKYRDSNNIIPTINSSIKDDYQRSVEFVKWLWKHYGHNKDGILSYPGSGLNFPTVKGSVAVCNKLYFNEKYGNDISEKLFSQNFYAFPCKEIFDIKDDKKDDFKEFIQHFGVLDFPKIEIYDINKPLESYDRIIKQDILNTGVFSGTTSTKISYCKYRLPYILDLEQMLQNMTTYDIIRWILKDHNLSATLDAKYYPSDANIRYHGNNQWSGTETKFTGRIRNYILAVFNNSAWIEINGKHIAPKDILNGFTSRTNQKFEQFIPVLTDKIINEICQHLGEKHQDIVSVLSKFQFAKHITDLSSDAFYGLLLTIQKNETPLNIDLFRAIYRVVEQPSNLKFDESENKRIFFRDGKLLVKYNSNLMYYPANQAYLPSAKIINKKAFHIIDKGQRTNNQNFVQIFGCKEYDKDYTIIRESEIISPLNNEFQSLLKEFFKYVRAYSERNENIGNNLSKLKITLVSTLNISENGVCTSIYDNYSLVRDTITNWFIVVNGTNYNVNELSICIENIFANIANTPGFDSNKIGELFRASSKEDREFLIQKEFGSLSVINDIEYNDIKQNFIDTIKKISPSYEIRECLIDFEAFDSTSNSRHIIELFNDINIDITDFEKAGFIYTIDVRNYFKSKLDKFIREEAIKFENALFTKAIGNIELQKEFISTVDRFNHYINTVEIINSINYDPINDIIKEFGEWRDIDNLQSARNAYNQNYKTLNPYDKYREEIGSDQKVRTMIYFNLKKEFDEWIGDKDNANIITYQSKDNEDIYSKYRLIKPRKTEILPIAEHNAIAINKKNIQHSRGVFSYQKEDNKNRKLKQIGNIGELLIYNLLKEEYGEPNVFPISEAFIELKILAPGLAKSGEYDISYKDTHNEEIYVEVKTGDRNTFYMTPHELAFAKEHSSCYYVYYVYDINTENPKYTILPIKFWENSKYQMKEIVEKIEFKF